MNFTYCKLKDILRSIHSGGTPSTSVKEYWGGPYKWLSSGETGQRFITDTKDTITERGIAESSTRHAEKESVVMACAGQGKTRGQTSFLLDEMYVNQSVIVLNPDKKKVLPLYLFYDLSGRYEELRGGSDASSTRGSITTSSLKTLPFRYPSVENQKIIISILYAYDKLIEVNNKRILQLEKMAENLYKEWFVRFRFPGHENTEFENGIPKGWRRDRISEFYITSSGGTPSRDNEKNYVNGNIPWIKTGELEDCLLVDTEEKITEFAIKKSSAKMFSKNSVLMAMYGVNIGKLAYSTIDATCNQACCVFRDKADFSTKHYLFQCLKSIRDYLLLISFGAAQQNLSQDLIKRVKIIMPDKDTLIRFEKRIEPLYEGTKLLLKSNANLIKQRDLLLPRLMNEKLEIAL